MSRERTKRVIVSRVGQMTTTMSSVRPAERRRPRWLASAPAVTAAAAERSIMDWATGLEQLGLGAGRDTGPPEPKDHRPGSTCVPLPRRGTVAPPGAAAYRPANRSPGMATKPPWRPGAGLPAVTLGRWPIPDPAPF